MIINYKDFLLENKVSTPEDYNIKKYEWVNGKLDCYQDVEIFEKGLTELPFEFGRIHGNFDCSQNKLTSLKGSPVVVDGYFTCCDNSLVNFYYAPKKIGSYLLCYNNQLTSLEGCPEILYDDFYCTNNKLSSFDGGPKEVFGDYYLGENKIDSIEDYPVCIVHKELAGYLNLKFKRINILIKDNIETFKPLVNNKIAFHQMIMRLRPDFIKYYTTINPPSKKSILMNI